MYIRTDGTTAGLLAGENTRPLTHPSTLQTTTKHCVGTAATFRPDGTSVEKKSAPVNSSARSHTGGMWPGLAATMASFLAFEEESGQSPRAWDLP